MKKLENLKTQTPKGPKGPTPLRSLLLPVPGSGFRGGFPIPELFFLLGGEKKFFLRQHRAQAACEVMLSITMRDFGHRSNPAQTTEGGREDFGMDVGFVTFFFLT